MIAIIIGMWTRFIHWQNINWRLTIFEILRSTHLRTQAGIHTHTHTPTNQTVQWYCRIEKWKSFKWKSLLTFVYSKHFSQIHIKCIRFCSALKKTNSVRRTDEFRPSICWFMIRTFVDMLIQAVKKNIHTLTLCFSHHIYRTFSSRSNDCSCGGKNPISLWPVITVTQVSHVLKRTENPIKINWMHF